MVDKNIVTLVNKVQPFPFYMNCCGHKIFKVHRKMSPYYGVRMHIIGCITTM